MRTLWPDRAGFAAVALRGRRVAVVAQVLADELTPVSAFRSLAGGPEPVEGRFLLESVDGGERIGRYSFLGLGVELAVRARAGQLQVVGPEGEPLPLCASGTDPFATLRRLLHLRRPVLAEDPAGAHRLPRFWGGCVGYLAYDAVRSFEPIGEGPADDVGIDDARFYFPQIVLAFDHVTRMLTAVTSVEVDGDPGRAHDRAAERLDQVLDQVLQGPVAGASGGASRAGSPTVGGSGGGLEGSLDGSLEVRSNFSPEAFAAAVRRAKAYIRAGDAFQIVVSQRLQFPLRAQPFEVYRALRALNPSPYMFFLDMGDSQLVGASPETFVQLEGGVARTRPIAGTRRRGATPAEDLALEKELLADEKELAEHVMLVDLGRNDLGRVCRYGTVRVDRLMAVERFSHVMHLVSEVSGRLREEADAFDLVQAAFPAGTVSGAPKVRAMQIIDELEPTRRGPYAGLVGYFGYDGNMDSCITIRSMLARDGWGYVQAGAGVVADSDPEREYEESLNKARAVLRAAEMAEGLAAGPGLGSQPVGRRPVVSGSGTPAQGSIPAVAAEARGA